MNPPCNRKSRSGNPPPTAVAPYFYPNVEFQTISTGASDDIARATDLARRMIVEFGMSDKLGSVRYAGQQLRYLGRSAEDSTHISPETREVIDKEVQHLITEQYNRAQEMLEKHGVALRALAKELLEHETVNGTAIRNALAEVASAAPRANAPQDKPVALPDEHHTAA